MKFSVLSISYFSFFVGKKLQDFSLSINYLIRMYGLDNDDWNKSVIKFAVETYAGYPSNINPSAKSPKKLYMTTSPVILERNDEISFFSSFSHIILTT
jgi:hypothetical protein